MRIRHINMLICEICMKRIQNAYKMYKVRARGRASGVRANGACVQRAGVGVARAWRGRGRRLCAARGRGRRLCVRGVCTARVLERMRGFV